MLFLDVLTTSFSNIHNNHYTSLILLDLTKAFDTVSHKIILHNLDHYGIRGPANNMILTFLQRKQFVTINGLSSKIISNCYGVPQGLILGPLLFLIYINDLSNSVYCTPRLFADVTCMVFSNPDLNNFKLDISLDLTGLIPIKYQSIQKNLIYREEKIITLYPSAQTFCRVYG